MSQKQRGKREEYMVQIGPILKKALDLQLESIKEVTHGVCKSSYYEAGEILGKKFLGEV